MMAAVSFIQPLGLLALLSLVPLIILYLIRNKPKNIEIPSLMFLMRDKGQIQKLSFLKKFFRNLLFFIQLLMLILLSLSVASPILTMPYDATSERTVLVIDASGSMNAKSGLSMRFDRAVSKAREELSGTISIVLAQETPLIVLEDGSRSEASDVLSKVKPRATKTNLQDSMIQSLDLLKGERGKIVVISDFMTHKGDDVGVAQRTITARGNKLKFINVKEDQQGKGNVGIVNLNVDKKETKVFIRNYNDREITVDVLVEKGKEVLDKKPIRILPQSIETLSFETVPGVSTITIDINDDLELDNKAYISAPDKKKIDALLITNKKSTSLKFALEASPNINLQTVELPVVPSFTQDVIILDKFDKKLLLPGTFEDISRFVKKGGVFVLTVQDDLHEVDFTKLNLVKLDGKKQETIACVDTINEITKQFATNRCFAKVSNYYSFEKPEDSTSIASAEDGTPLILIKGKILFYNINDQYSDFNRLPAYPIFWDSILRFMVGEENINEFNVPTGTIKIIEQQDVKTPSGVVQTNKVIMDEAGLYEIAGKKVAANMLDEQESDIYHSETDIEEEQNQMEIKTVKAKEDFNIELPLIILVIFFIILELVIVKFRGEL